MNAPTTNSWELIIQAAEPEFTQIALLDGNVVNFQREAEFLLQRFRTDDYLPKCSSFSIRNTIINVASIGLTLNPAMKLCYPVARKGQCCLDISVFGLIKIATDSGSILGAKAEIVRRNDLRVCPKTGLPGFIYHGPFEKPTHNFNPFASNDERGEIVGVYSIAMLHNGAVMVDHMNNEEIEKIRNASKASNGPWFTWFEEMIKKSVLKRASKTWPKTERLAKVEKFLNDVEGNEIDITPVATPPRLPPRPNGAQIAAATLAVPDSDERSAFLAEVNRRTRAEGLAFYEDAYRAMTGQQRKWLGKDTHEAMWKLANEVDDARRAQRRAQG